MHVVSMPPLLAFMAKHPIAADAIRTWCDETRKATWTQPADIKTQFATASILKSRRVVFNIKGNDYRLIASIAYNTSFVFVKFIGTHAEYDAVDANTVNAF
jgi:mRNA interferase HigB